MCEFVPDASLQLRGAHCRMCDMGEVFDEQILKGGRIMKDLGSKLAGAALSLNRRKVIAGVAAAVTVPFIPKVGHAADVDVVIIGAGAAGLGAARSVMARGRTFKLLEGGDRIGGRAYTDTTTFGVPFDQGCTFQHIAARNPWVQYARANGFEVGKMPGDDVSRVNVGRREARSGEYDAMSSRYDAAKAAISYAGRNGWDVSARRATQNVKKDKWTALAEFWLRVGMGREFEDLACKDWWSGADGENYYAPAGYGTMVAHYGKDVPVETGAVVTEIDWSGSGVKVSTADGRTISAKACIVTVSIGVLASGSISFKPQLPAAKRNALSRLTMGHYVTIGLKFKSKRILPVTNNAWFWVDSKSDEMFEFMSNMGDHGVSRANASGKLAVQLQEAGKDAAVDLALERLVDGLGPRVRDQFVEGSLHSWSKDPLVLGSWAGAVPGKTRPRPQIGRRVGRSVYFAGEAYHPDMWATCHGALISGQTVGKQVAARV